MEKKTNGIILGKAGELRVASELLLRGHLPSLNLVDKGIDIMLEDGRGIQVKCAHKICKRSDYPKYGTYTFAFRTWERKVVPHKLEGVDFVILWAIDDNSFFVIPADKIRGRYSVELALGNRGWSDFLNYKDNWGLLERQ